MSLLFFLQLCCPYSSLPKLLVFFLFNLISRPTPPPPKKNKASFIKSVIYCRRGLKPLWAYTNVKNFSSTIGHDICISEPPLNQSARCGSCSCLFVYQTSIHTQAMDQLPIFKPAVYGPLAAVNQPASCGLEAFFLVLVPLAYTVVHYQPSTSL